MPWFLIVSNKPLKSSFECNFNACWGPVGREPRGSASQRRHLPWHKGQMTVAWQPSHEGMRETCCSSHNVDQWNHRNGLPRGRGLAASPAPLFLLAARRSTALGCFVSACESQTHLDLWAVRMSVMHGCPFRFLLTWLQGEHAVWTEDNYLYHHDTLVQWLDQ